jgi:hypothetical protein
MSHAEAVWDIAGRGLDIENSRLLVRWHNAEYEVEQDAGRRRCDSAGKARAAMERYLTAKHGSNWRQVLFG